MKTKIILPILILLIISGAILFWPRGTEVVTANMIAPEDEVVGFLRAEGIEPFTFPQDFGPHEDFQTEWWYYTGNLDDEQGNHYGFQLTFFRRALLPQDQLSERSSEWAVEQIYFAHFALSDIGNDQFYFFERFARGANQLAGAQSVPYQVWLENWSVTQQADGTLQLFAQSDGITLDLILTDIKGPVPQGDEGYSQKGPENGNASFYYSQSRLGALGTITIDGNTNKVSGLSWKDHEYSTSALSPGQVGWDWFSIQLDNDMELMLFYLRREDGSIDQYSSGTLIFSDGTTQHLTLKDFTITVEDYWRSPTTEAEYPSQWTISIPDYEIELAVKPYIENQELLVSFIYWEGAVSITGTIGGDLILSGHGYVELTGYFASMEGEF